MKGEKQETDQLTFSNESFEHDTAILSLRVNSTCVT